MLIIAGLIVAAAAILAAFVALVRRDGGEPEPEGATVYYAAELHDMNEAPVDVEPGPAVESGQRHLADDWRDLVEPAPAPELGSPAYRSRHHDDTVEMVAGAYQPLVNPALAEVLGYDRHDTAYMAPIR